MTLGGVTDLAGNVIIAPVTWSFVMKDFSAMQSSVQLTGIKLAVPFSYNLTLPNNTLAANLTTTVANFLQISPHRLTNFVFSAAPDGTTLCAVTVLSSSTTGARRAANDNLSIQQLLQMLQDGIMSGSLNIPVTNDSTV